MINIVNGGTMSSKTKGAQARSAICKCGHILGQHRPRIGCIAYFRYADGGRWNACRCSHFQIKGGSHDAP